MLVMKCLDLLPKCPLNLYDVDRKGRNAKLRFCRPDKTDDLLSFTWHPGRQRPDLQLDVRGKVLVIKNFWIYNMKIERLNGIKLDTTNISKCSLNVVTQLSTDVSASRFVYQLIEQALLRL